MPPAEVETLLAFFKAMSNESRLRIIGLLAGRERSVRELAELLDLKEPTVCHHLAELKAIGLVVARAEGVTRWHALRLETLSTLNRTLLEPARVTELARAAAGVTAGEGPQDERVLAGYLLPDGRLKAVPASRRKRAVVLRWLARQFEPGRRYPEAEVNELLGRRHWDSATLRRELVGHRMLAREAGLYWRLPEAEWREEPERGLGT